MPKPGAAVYEQLQSALDDSRSAASREKRDYDLLDGQINEFVARKGAALLDLARHYLPEFSRSAIESTFAEMRVSLLEVLGRKERTQAELTARAARFVETCRSLDAKLADITGQLNEQVRRREQLEIEVASLLAEDTEFQRLSREAAQMEARLQQNEARVHELQSSANEKLPTFERSQLFLYLYQLGYGTSEYQAKGITRSLDKWVADMIDFPKARNGYEFLKTTPKLMAEEVARRKSEFKSLMEQIESIEDRHHDAVGLTAVLAEGRQCGATRDEVVATLETTHREQQAVDTELGLLDQSQGNFYEEAIQRFEQFLSQTETGVLQTRAERTPDPRDDEIVARIADLTGQIDGLKRKMAQSMLDRKRADELAGGMDLVVNRYRQNNFDSERSSFAEGLDIDGELHRYQLGLTKPEELWQVIRRQQQFEQNWAEAASTQGAQVALQVFSHPAVSQALLNATIQVVGGALNTMAQSGIERRAPERQARQQQQGRPPIGGHFTTGKGF